MKRLLITLLTIVTAIGATTAATPKRQKLAPEAPSRKCWAEGHANYYRQYPLYGNVESITIHYKRTYGNEVKVEEIAYLTFNERGDVMCDASTNLQGDTTCLMKMEYNSHGDVTSCEIWDYGKLRSRNEYLYNKGRKQQVWREYNEEGEIVFEKTCNYDPQTRTVIHDKSPYEKDEHQIDAGGINCKTEYDPPYWIYGSHTSITTYNDIGKIAHFHYMYDETIEHTSYNYDKRGLVTEEITWSNNIKYSVSDGINSVEGIELPRVGIKEHYKIERDKRGNVIKIVAEPDYSGFKSVTTYDINYRK